MDSAIRILQHEIAFLASYQSQLDRRMQVFAEGSDDWRGAKQAKDVTIDQIREFQAAVALLQAAEPPPPEPPAHPEEPELQFTPPVRGGEDYGR